MNSPSEICKWLHEQLEPLELVRFPFNLEDLPKNGIYFFYESGELWGHGGERQRIVRIGTHRDGNFRSRIAEHYLLDERKMSFDKNRPAPHERSIFRKNIGRVILSRGGDAYLSLWELDFTSKAIREKFGQARDIEKEKRLEKEITQILRENFSFRFIGIEKKEHRTGSKGLEAPLIGTVSGCRLCTPSSGWLGKCSPRRQIREGHLWLVQHLTSPPLSEGQMQIVAQLASARVRKV